MKILLCSFWTLPHVGGMSTYTQYLKEGLENLGYEVDIFAHHPSFDSYYILDKPEIRFPKLPIWQPIYTYIQNYYNQLGLQMDSWVLKTEAERYSFEFACSLLELDAYDLIHVQDLISATALTRIKPYSVPLISTVHGWFTNEYNLDHPESGEGSLTWRYNQYLENTGVSNCDLAIFPSKWLYNIFAGDMDIPAARLIQVPYGIKAENYLTKRNHTLELKPPGHKVLSCIARLVPLKGHRYVLEALSMLKKERTDWVCYIIGEGNQREQLEVLSKQLGLDKHVQFVGKTDDVPSWLQQSDIVLLPSIQDNQPFVIIEAQLSGKPIIVTDAGGMPEMVEHGKTGLIAQKASAESIYSHIKTLMENEEMCLKLGNAARLRAQERWTIDKMINRVIALYKQAILQKSEENSMKNTVRQVKAASIKSVYPYADKNLLDNKDLENWKQALDNFPSNYTVPDPNVVKLIQKSV